MLESQTLVLNTLTLQLSNIGDLSLRIFKSIFRFTDIEKNIDKNEANFVFWGSC
mgnify:CR=1 FL=1